MVVAKTRGQIFWVLWCLLQQLLVVVFLWRSKGDIGLTLSGGLAFTTIVVNNIFAWLAAILIKNNDTLLKKIIAIMSVTNVQYLLFLSAISGLNMLSLMLQPILLYAYTIEISNLLLYNQIAFKNVLDKTFLIIVLAVTVPLFINQRLFNILYLVTFILLHFYPCILLLVYSSNFKNILHPLKHNCQLFAVILILNLILSVFGELFVTGSEFYNFGWYFMIFIFNIISYFRIVHSRLALFFKRVFGGYHVNWLIIPSVIFLVWLLLLSGRISNLNIFLTVVNVSILVILCLLSYFYFQVKRHILVEDKVGIKGVERLLLSNTIKSEESIKNEIATYLHDDILQTIIALKNLVLLKQTEEIKNILVEELNSLIFNLRDRMDKYYPILSSDNTLKENYQRLIDERMRLRGIPSKLVTFDCSDDIYILPPYNTIVYRLLKEIINNALKYTKGYEIVISLRVYDDIITIHSRNLSANDGKVIKGRGLNTIAETVELLNGTVECENSKGEYRIYIMLPVDRKICYENFID